MIKHDAITAIAARHPFRIAVQHGKRTLNWATYEQEVGRLVSWLNQVVTAPDATAVIEAAASIPVFVLASAFASVGIPWVALDSTRSIKIRDVQKSLVAPEVMVYEDSKAGLVLHVPSAGLKVAFDAVPRVNNDSPASTRPFRSVGFTSGTTGSPKMVLRSRASEGRRNDDFIRRFGFCNDDRFLLCLPLAHASGHGWARTFLTAGGTVVIGEPSEDDIAYHLGHGGITATLIVPPVLSRVVDRLRDQYGSVRISSRLRFLLTGGRHLSPGLVGKTWQLFGSVLHSYYGTTETGVNALAEPVDFLVDPRTSGTVLDGSSIQIVDNNGNSVPNGNVGRVVIASYMNADSYHTGSVPTVLLNGKEHIITADFGYFTGSSLRIVGRANDQAQPIACGDLFGFEEDLRLLPRVVDAAAVVGTSGEFADVFIAVDNDAASMDEALVSYLATKLARQRGVNLSIDTHIVPQLRFNSTGKFDSAETLVLANN